jgi:hypothetical protein
VDARFYQVLERLELWLERPKNHSFRRDTVRLLDRLLEDARPQNEDVSPGEGAPSASWLDTTRAPLSLERPSRVFYAIRHEALSWQDAQPTVDSALELTALLDIAEARHFPREKLAETLWQAWFDADTPHSAGWLALATGRHAAALFPALKRTLFDACLAKGSFGDHVLPFAHFTRDQWAVFARRFDVLLAPRPELQRAAWSHLPIDRLHDALSGGAFRELDQAARTELWDRAEEPLVTWLFAHLDPAHETARAVESTEQVFRWLAAAPPRLDTRLVD